MLRVDDRPLGEHDQPIRLPPEACRRTLLKLAIAGGLAAFPGAARAAGEPQDPAKLRPQPDDRFVHVSGDKKGEEVRPDDLQKGAAQLLAWPLDPQTRTVRDGSLLNQVLIVRLDTADLDDATKSRAADGIVAYSAICTHAQCPVTGWNGDKKLLHCPCHQSDYDPSQNAKVVFGPAPRSLPALPLRIDGGVLVAAAAFTGRIGVHS